MIKNVIAGILIGVANIIPGVSGGTIIVLLGLFDRTMESISNIFKIDNKNRKQDILFLIQLFLGVGIGLVSFAKLLEILFSYAPTQTFFWFVGMILSSLPSFIKKEMKDVKLSKVWVIVGILLIGFLFLFSNGNEEMVINEFPKLSIYLLITLILVGMIGGGTMIFPGISGSMVLIIIGKYYLFKSYVANVLSFKIEIIIPLLFIGFGILLGVILSAKLTSYLLKKYKSNTLSFIIGLIIMSSIMMIPFDVKYDFITLSTSILSLLFGIFIVLIIEKISKKKALN